METKKERLKKLIAESDGFAERGNKVVLNLKRVDTRKIVLTSDPFAAKREMVSLKK